MLWEQQEGSWWATLYRAFCCAEPSSWRRREVSANPGAEASPSQRPASFPPLCPLPPALGQDPLGTAQHPAGSSPVPCSHRGPGLTMPAAHRRAAGTQRRQADATSPHLASRGCDGPPAQRCRTCPAALPDPAVPGCTAQAGCESSCCLQLQPQNPCTGKSTYFKSYLM